MSEICSPSTPHGFECHCEGRFRHIAPDALWALLMLIQRSALETILKAGFQGVAKTGLVTQQHKAALSSYEEDVEKFCCLCLSFRWQPDIATTQMSTSSLRRWCEYFPTRLNSD